MILIKLNYYCFILLLVTLYFILFNFKQLKLMEDLLISMALFQTDHLIVCFIQKY